MYIYLFILHSLCNPVCYCIIDKYFSMDWLEFYSYLFFYYLCNQFCFVKWTSLLIYLWIDWFIFSYLFLYSLIYLSTIYSERSMPTQTPFEGILVIRLEKYRGSTKLMVDLPETMVDCAWCIRIKDLGWLCLVRPDKRPWLTVLGASG